jgi:methyl-galactoside transport system substrate-binding protein
MNKIPCKSLLLLPFLCLSACQSASQKAEIFIYDSTDAFIQSLQNYLIEDLEDYIAYHINYAERKQTTQNDQFLTAISESSTKILLMNMVDRLASSALIEKAETKKIPIIFMNREPLVSDFSSLWAQADCYYVGGDPANQGSLQADIANELFGGSLTFKGSVFDKNKDGIVQITILKGEEGHQDSEQRSRYCISRLEELGYSVSIQNAAYCNWERSLARKNMATLYSESTELLFANNDEMALGAIEYLQNDLLKNTSSSSSALNLPFYQRYFPIIGVDATDAGQAAIKAGTLYGTVLNNAIKQASVIVDLSKHLLENKAIPTYGGEDLSVSGNFYHVAGEKITKATL